MGAAAIPVLTMPGSYYLGFVVMGAALATRRPRIGLALLLATAGWAICVVAVRGPLLRLRGFLVDPSRVHGLAARGTVGIATTRRGRPVVVDPDGCHPAAPRRLLESGRHQRRRSSRWNACFAMAPSPERPTSSRAPHRASACVSRLRSRRTAPMSRSSISTAAASKPRATRSSQAVPASTPLVVPCNVTEEDDVKRAVASALEAGGRVNGVVNVAGITRDARIAKKSYDDFKLVVGSICYGTFLFTREVAAQHWQPLFKDERQRAAARRRESLHRELLVGRARNGNVGQIDYTAAKGAIEAATRTTAREFASFGARVNAIAPGPIDTPMLAGVGEAGIKLMAAATLTGRIGQPEEMAAVVCALADPKIFGYATGQVFQVNGGLYLA